MNITPTPSRPERKATLRFGQRELNYITLFVALIVIAGVLWGGYRGFMSFKAQRDIVIAQENLHTLYSAMLLYSKDFDGRLPKADHWTDAILGYLSASSSRPGGREAFLHGPADNGEVGYAFNTYASEYNFEPSGSFTQKSDTDTQSSIDPDRTVLLIEKPNASPNATVSIPPINNVNDQAILYKALSFPHNTGDPENAKTVILYLSGRIDVVTRRDMRPQ